VRFRVYIAASLDGFIATSDGGVDWLEPFFGEDYGYEAFMSEISCAVMGRSTYQHVLEFGEWPYTEHDVFVLTRSPIESLPARVFPWTGTPAELVDHLRGEERDGDCWVIGGGLTIREFERLGAVDEYQVFVMPLFLGSGVRLFATPYPEGAVRLLGVTAWDNGVVRLLYEAGAGGPDRD